MLYGIPPSPPSLQLAGMYLGRPGDGEMANRAKFHAQNHRHECLILLCSDRLLYRLPNRLKMELLRSRLPDGMCLYRIDNPTARLMAHILGTPELSSAMSYWYYRPPQIHPA